MALRYPKNVDLGLTGAEKSDNLRVFLLDESKKAL
jgi:hypothetical protein